MSEYLLSQYRPVADALLTAHDLTVDDAERDALAKVIMHSRRTAPRATGESYSSLPALMKAATHAKALVKYSDKKPSGAASIPTRAASLASALRDPFVSWCMASETDVELSALLGTLDGISLSPSTMSSEDIWMTLRNERDALVQLLAVLEQIKGRKKEHGLTGRPWAITKPIVRRGYIVWRRAGRMETFAMFGDLLGGPLPAFLREILACCNGTHPLVMDLERKSRPVPPEGYSFEWPKVRGDGLDLSDATLQRLLVECGADTQGIGRYLESFKNERLS